MCYPAYLLLFPFHALSDRLMWPGKTCLMESLSTYAASEKAIGSERKHCKGKIVPSNFATLNVKSLF